MNQSYFNSGFPTARESLSLFSLLSFLHSPIGKSVYLLVKLRVSLFKVSPFELLSFTWQEKTRAEIESLKTENEKLTEKAKRKQER